MLALSHESWVDLIILVFYHKLSYVHVSYLFNFEWNTKKYTSQKKEVRPSYKPLSVPNNLERITSVSWITLPSLEENRQNNFENNICRQ